MKAKVMLFDLDIRGKWPLRTAFPGARSAASVLYRILFVYCMVRNKPAVQTWSYLRNFHEHNVKFRAT
jgi:hypothetical protein